MLYIYIYLIVPFFHDIYKEMKVSSQLQFMVFFNNSDFNKNGPHLHKHKKDHYINLDNLIWSCPI
jgi:hypothetical protein